jgi:hypothetical protein
MRIGPEHPYLSAYWFSLVDRIDKSVGVEKDDKWRKRGKDLPVIIP